MLNYVKHNEEFHCTVKLKDGAEIIGRAMVSFDEEIQTHVVYIQDPVQINVIINDKGDGKAVRGIGFSKWMNFSDEDFFILTENNILTMASLAPEMIGMYEMFLISEEEDKLKDTDIYKNSQPADTIKGCLGTIEEARKKLEDIFKK